MRPRKSSALEHVEILCSSRELFGADRSALRLGEALREIGLSPTLVLPAERTELGLCAEAARRGIPTREDRIAIASSKGVETPTAMVASRRRRAPADLTIFNTTAVLSAPARVTRKVLVVREWLEPSSPRHRVLATRHRIRANAVVGVSAGVVHQWRKCVYGPTQQYIVHNWLDRSTLDSTAAHAASGKPTGILCIGRFNRWKGQDVLADAYIEAFSAQTDRPALTFVGAQPGTIFDMRAEAVAATGKDFGWKVLPFTSNPSPYFSSAALVVVPSLQPEPFGTVILEAIAHGCRVIAFDGGGPSDIASALPGIVELVSRERGDLASALASWWASGGSALTASEFAEVRRKLESDYSPEAGAASWRHIVQALVS
jgi:glycosyltransferase involved in cell wall biosynthesis